MLSKIRLLKTARFAFLLGFLFLTLNFPTLAESQPEELESQVKKIVMMMNIVGKEYHAGIAEGKVINLRNMKRARYSWNRRLVDTKN